jgi:hypothetical protein
MNEKASEAAERLRRQWSGPMTDAEIEFLRDVQGFIEFAIRNGLTFTTVMSGLLHDVNEVARTGLDYEKARSHGFVPKVTGFSNVSSKDFGEGEEPELAS